MIIITGHVITSPETATETARLCKEHSARSQAEPGCPAHNVHADCEEPARLVFVERRADTDALRAHFALAESQAFVREIRALSPAPTEMKIYMAEESSPAR